MKKNTGFEKFSNKKKAGTIKEAHRQEKRVVRKEREEAIKERRTTAKAGPTPPSIPRNKSAASKSRPGSASKSRAGSSRDTHGDADSPGTGATSSRAGARPRSMEERSEKTTGGKKSIEKRVSVPSGDLMPLNKFIAHAGVCARRDAAALVKEGVVSVNGTIVSEPGFKVSDKDDIKLRGKKIVISQNLIYILLNKPKDFITTTEDPQGRKTVLDLIKTATTERVYPIGRLDRNTSGVLLFTNDGELAQSLSHPKNKIKKIYEVKLDKPLTKNDFDTIANGITLEDGFVQPDALGYADTKDKTVIGIEIHSGKNRIVRRIFEHMKYDVRGLDRVMYAGLTKKNVNRGKWRYLAEKEVRILKHFNKDAKKEKDTQ